jgi:HupE / UreJ protein
MSHLQRHLRHYLLLCLCALFSLNVHAHKPSDSYLTLKIEGQRVQGQWDIALRDLDFALGLDVDGNAEITWGELRAKHTEIAAYTLSRLKISHADLDCPIEVTQHLVDDHTDGAYAVMRFEAVCQNRIEQLQVQYGLFFDIDPQHKGLLRMENGESINTGIFSPEQARQTFNLQSPGKLHQFFEYGREGVWHIWIGFDHILFLLALLLPAVVVREEKVWRAVQAFKPAFWMVLKIVTAFTVAHSITLTLATLELVTLPSRWVESTIAASVIIAALNNIYPLFSERRWMMAFIFGLIHGFGFAGALSDLGLPQKTLALALAGFNLGVEIGQLAIVAVFLPLAFALRDTWFYRRVVLLGGSILISIIALLWLIERVGNIKLLPF